MISGHRAGRSPTCRIPTVRRVPSVLCVVVALMLVPLAVSARTTGWALERVPPPMVANGQLMAVSCVSARFCMSVGQFSGARGLPLVELWNGHRWSLRRFRGPSWSTETELSSVSCVTGRACAAVGFTTTASRLEQPLASWWNGRRWLVEPLMDRYGNGAALTGVSCVSASMCVAIGSGAQAGDEIAERWDGRSWVAMPRPTTSATVGGVSCPDVRVCWAVGSGADGARELPRVWRWNGSRWRSVPAPAAIGPIGSGLDAIACTGPDACTAVGHYSRPGPGMVYRPRNPTASLVERWTGRRWAAARVPGSQAYSSLSSVSCPIATGCEAVGSSPEGPIVARATSGGWRGVRISGRAIQNASLAGVSCVATSGCVAVGTTISTENALVTFATVNVGAHVHFIATVDPLGATVSTLTDVSCLSSINCMAVGQYGADQPRPFAERWNGTRWRIALLPIPAGALAPVRGSGNGEFLTMTGISCPASDACTAVGAFQTATEPRGSIVFAEQWDGRRWSLLPLQRLNGGAHLNAVVCPSSSECLAVGQDGTAPLAEVIGPGRWAQQTIPAPTGASVSALNSVSCSSSSSCLTVGYSAGATTANTPLVDFWDGSAWSIATLPNTASLGTATLEAVACNTTQCTIVGSNGQLLAENQHGTGWSQNLIPQPAGWQKVEASSLACPTTSNCELVGTLTHTVAAAAYAAFSGEPLLESWNGLAWTQQTSPSQPNVQQSSLAGISCPGPSSCVAVGGNSGPFGFLPLIERYTGG